LSIRRFSSNEKQITSAMDSLREAFEVVSASLWTASLQIGRRMITDEHVTIADQEKGMSGL
jgi:hypothetical protein